MNGSLEQALAERLDQLAARGRSRKLTLLTDRRGPCARIDDVALLNLSSNDYLGLGADTELLARFLASADGVDLDHYGMTASASRLLTGHHPACARLEEELSALYGGRAALVFGSGYQANVGICSALAGKGDLFLADKLCHASLIDGMRLSGARLLRYRHGDLAHLESLLEKSYAKYRRVFIVSESVFSMEGDVADLPALVRLKQRYGTALIVDEAHALGVFGEAGLGLAVQYDLTDHVDVLIGTFGKALASFGAFVISSQTVHDYLVNHARSFIFTTALPPSTASWTRLTLARAVTMQAERKHLLRVAGGLRRGLAAAGIETRGASQIVPALVGKEECACRLAEILQDEGFLVLPIRPPTVPPHTSRLRFSVTANMTADQLRRIPDIITGAWER